MINKTCVEKIKNGSSHGTGNDTAQIFPAYVFQWSGDRDRAPVHAGKTGIRGGLGWKVVYLQKNTAKHQNAGLKMNTFLPNIQ